MVVDMLACGTHYHLSAMGFLDTFIWCNRLLHQFHARKGHWLYHPLRSGYSLDMLYLGRFQHANCT
jgi:hypothetical protein